METQPRAARGAAQAQPSGQGRARAPRAAAARGLVGLELVQVVTCAQRGGLNDAEVILAMREALARLEDLAPAK